MDFKMLSVTKIEGEIYYKLIDVADILKVQRCFFNRTARISMLKQEPGVTLYKKTYYADENWILHTLSITRSESVKNQLSEFRALLENYKKYLGMLTEPAEEKKTGEVIELPSSEKNPPQPPTDDITDPGDEKEEENLTFTDLIPQEQEKEPSKLEQLLSEIERKNEIIRQLEEKAHYYDVVINSPELISTSVIAQEFKLSALKLNKVLEKYGIQFTDGQGRWNLYAKYLPLGLVAYKTMTRTSSTGDLHTTTYRCWTQKGRKFIYDLLSSEGYEHTNECSEKVSGGSHDE